jgi:polyisoprenoid-binding protein YceI
MKIALALSLSTFLVMGQTFAKDLVVDTAASTITWTGTKVTGSSHTGPVSVKEGKVVVNDKGELTGGSVVADMTTIGTTDLQGEWAEKLVGHLKNDDFFAVDKNPTATFVITSVAKKGNDFEVKGDLTVKGKKAAQTVVLKKEGNAYSGKLEFDRTAYDIRYGSGKFFQNLGDNMINDKVALDLKIVTK